MKKLFRSLIILTIVLSFSLALGQQKRIPPPGKEVIPSADCSWLTFYGALCQDIDDGKIYKWDGITQTELAAGASGDMTKAAYDADSDNRIDAVAGGTDINTSASTGTPYITAGTWSIKSAADEMTALGFTANAQTLIGETFAQMQGSLSIDDLIALSGQVEGSTHHGVFTGTTIADNQNTTQALQALETSVETKAPVANPTFTGVVQMPNAALKLADTNASHYLIIKPGSDLDADRILTITTGNAARTLNIEGDSTVDQDVSANANPSFSTANLVGANALTLGTSRTNDGKITFKSGTALNDFVFTITGGNFGADLAWALPLAAPAGANYLLNVDADGTMGYTDPASIGGLSSDCTVPPCLDGSSDGGTRIRMYDGDSHYTQIGAGNSAGNLTFTFPTAASGGNNYLLNFDADGTGGFTDPASFQTADPTLTALAALVFADVTIVAGTGADAVEIVTSGGNYRFLGSNVDNTSLSFQALTLDLIADSATYQRIAATDVDASSHVNLVQDLDGTGAVQFTGLSVTRAITVDDAAQELAARNRANTFTGNNIFGDADTDTLTIRSIIAGGNSRAVQITDSLASPTYATGPTEIYVKGDVEVGGIVYAVGGFESILPPGNVGYMRAKEDSAYATGGNVNFRGFTMLDADYTQDLEFTFPTGLPSANDLLVLGAPALNKSAISYSGLASLMGSVFGTTQGSILYRSGSAWIALAPDTAGKVLQTGGGGANPSWATITATAAGASGNLQYNSGTNTLAAEAALSYNSTTNTFGIIQNGTDPTLTTGDGTYTWVYTPQVGIEGVLEVQGGAYISTLLMVPSGANPTTNAAGQIAVDTSAGAGSMLRFYGDAAYAIPATIPGNPVIVLSPTSSSDHYYMFTPYAITIKAVHYLSKTGEWVGQLNICDANGGSCGATQAANTTTVAGTTTNVTSFTDATVPAGVWIALATTSVGSPAPTELIVQMDYVVDQVN